MLCLLVSLLCATVMSENITIIGDGWKYWCVGSCETHKKTKTTGGRIMMGGGTDVDEAFLWLIKNSGGGDILVLRASGTDAYNDYILALGNGVLNSVATLLINGTGPAYDPIVLEKIKDSEGLWFAGGDQWNYYHWWQNTPLLEAVQSLADSNVTIGGTSAGMAIQPQFIFTAQYDTITSPMALKDPYDKHLTLGSNYLRGSFLENAITDTHFVERDRMGRSFAFLARIMKDHKVKPLGIACDQSTAVLIENSGVGRVVIQPDTTKVFDRPLRKAYFFVPSNPPDLCEPRTPLDFRGITVYRLGDGDVFDFNDRTTKDGEKYSIDVRDGVLFSYNNGGHIY